jgi:hypothetical protein
MAQREDAAVLRTRPHRDGARRREILTMLGGAAAWPLAAQGQDAGPRKRIGVLLSARQDDREYEGYIAGFRETLEMRGWSERRNIRIDFAGERSRHNRKSDLQRNWWRWNPMLL